LLNIRIAYSPPPLGDIKGLSRKDTDIKTK
jgi:hypothetical protein